MAIAPDDSVVIADTFNHRVRPVFSTAPTLTVAASGSCAIAGNGGTLNLALARAPHCPTRTEVSATGVVEYSDNVTPPESEPRLTQSEQRRLKEIERQLLAQFPSLAGTLRDSSPATLPNALERRAAITAAVMLIVVAVIVGGGPGAAAVAVTLVATAGVWLAMQRLGQPPRPRRDVRRHQPPAAI